MQRLFIAVTLVLMLLGGRAAVLAAPSAQERKPVIAQPEEDSVVRGVVQVVGSATHPQFQRYELYYAPYPVPSDNAWIFIGDAHFQQQPLGLLGTWPTGSLPDGPYVLRVRVVRIDGNYTDSDPRRVIVANRRPPDTPTPAITEAPTPVPTPLPPTPTVVITVPTVEPPRAATPVTDRPVATPTPEAVAPAAPRATATPALADLFDAGRLVDTAQRAATYTFGFFVAVGAFFGVKAMLAWLWHRLRP